MYIFVFSQVALLDTRLSAMGASLCAQETSSVIVASAEVILTAVTEIRGSGRLRFLLRAFLDLSNALAKSSKSHETMTGIKLASLEKVQQSKVNSGETVLQYVVGKIAIKMPEALQVGTDMPSLEEARLVLFPRMAADLRKLGEGVDTMKKIIDFDRAAKEAEVGKEAGTEKAGVEVGKEGVDMGKEEGAGKEAGTGAEVEASAESTGVEGADDRPSLLGRDSTVSMEAVAVVAPLSPIERAHQEAQRLHLRASERLAEAQRDFAELCAYFGETDVEPDKLFGQVIAFVRGVEGAAKTTKKRKSAGGRRPVIKLPNMIQ
ncbi:hypothetical protein B484DRAFT_448924 [Ochromonadaceae sp. CCMP2298]|nr:hypothetical protein B484DRAFT_448924 [Ochromonadaceae sp. CCMP2298]